jgi:predicted RNA-binding Zn ribbon-like protein
MGAYRDRGAVLAADLINTHFFYQGEPEILRDPADLQRFLKQHDIDAEATERDLHTVRELRGKLRQMWETDDLEAVTRGLNELLGDVCATPHYDIGKSGDLQLAFAVEPGAPLLERLTVDTALGIGALVQHYGIERLRACAGVPCHYVFVDKSRNRSRRFCCEQCANRYNVAAFRRRQRGG